MALSDCYMLRDIQKYKGETVLNVYFYQDLLLAATAQTVVDAWIAGVQPKVINLQAPVIHHVLVDAVNLADPGNFYEKAQDVQGALAGDSLPAHSALNFGLRLNSRALKPGSKRICGVSEPAQDDGEIVDTDVLGFIEAYRVQLKSILMSGVLLTFQPIVIKRVAYTVPGSSPARQAYRLPENDGEFVFGNVVEAVTTTHVSHQVSRGNGR